jgi:hypothetical protein
MTCYRRQIKWLADRKTLAMINFWSGVDFVLSHIRLKVRKMRPFDRNWLSFVIQRLWHQQNLGRGLLCNVLTERDKAYVMYFSPCKHQIELNREILPLTDFICDCKGYVIIEDWLSALRSCGSLQGNLRIVILFSHHKSTTIRMIYIIYRHIKRPGNLHWGFDHPGLKLRPFRSKSFRGVHHGTTCFYGKAAAFSKNQERQIISIDFSKLNADPAWEKWVDKSRYRKNLESNGWWSVLGSQSDRHLHMSCQSNIYMA